MKASITKRELEYLTTLSLKAYGHRLTKSIAYKVIMYINGNGHVGPNYPSRTHIRYMAEDLIEARQWLNK